MSIKFSETIRFGFLFALIFFLLEVCFSTDELEFHLIYRHKTEPQAPEVIY